MSLGASIVKMKVGHHGANHPVQDTVTHQVMVTSQNHNFVVYESSLPSKRWVTHRSLFDGSVQGLRHIKKPLYGFQGHPEGSSGPLDALNKYLVIRTKRNQKRY